MISLSFLVVSLLMAKNTWTRVKVTIPSNTTSKFRSNWQNIAEHPLCINYYIISSSSNGHPLPLPLLDWSIFVFYFLIIHNSHSNVLKHVQHIKMWKMRNKKGYSPCKLNAMPWQQTKQDNVKSGIHSDKLFST